MVNENLQKYLEEKYGDGVTFESVENSYSKQYGNERTLHYKKGNVNKKEILSQFAYDMLIQEGKKNS